MKYRYYTFSILAGVLLLLCFIVFKFLYNRNSTMPITNRSVICHVDWPSKPHITQIDQTDSIVSSTIETHNSDTNIDMMLITTKLFNMENNPRDVSQINELDILNNATSGYRDNITKIINRDNMEVNACNLYIETFDPKMKIYRKIVLAISNGYMFSFSMTSKSKEALDSPQANQVIESIRILPKP